MLIFDIQENDVLLGRGALTVNNEGNKRFRTIVEPWKAEYRGGNRKRKNEIASIVVKKVFEGNGRFLERVGGEQLHTYGLPEHSRAWKVADMNVAMEKAKQALRSKDPLPGQQHSEDFLDNEHELPPPSEQPMQSNRIEPAASEIMNPPTEQLQCNKPPALPLHTHQLRQEDIAGHVMEIMLQNTPGAPPHPTTSLHQQQQNDLFNPFMGNLHVNEQEQIDHLLRTEGGRRFRTAAATSPSPHDAVWLNELAHIQQQQQSMVGGVVAATLANSVMPPSADEGDDDEFY